MEPGYALPCRKTISSIISRKHALGIEELRCVLQKVDGLAITSDLWTSKATEGYASVTGHFLDVEWRLQTCLLKTCNFPQQHTGRNIADLVLHVASLFGINVDGLSVFVYDEASNMVCAGRLLEERQASTIESFVCACHRIQNCIRDAMVLDSIVSMLSAGRRLVGHFKHGSKDTTALRNRQKQKAVPE